jgi:hypothetical protein
MVSCSSWASKWLSQNHADGIAAIDLFVVPAIGFDLLYGLAIVHSARRRLVWANVTPNPTAGWIARRMAEAFRWEESSTTLHPRP